MPLYSDSVNEQVAGLLSEAAHSDLPLTRAALQENALPEFLHDTPAARLFPNARDPGAALSGLLLRIGRWEESHQRAQDLSTREGSYWHAIVHRMEPDFANSGYWYRRVGPHPIFAELRSRAATIAASYPDAKLEWPSPWDPYFFNRFCEEALGHPGRWQEKAGAAVQTAEWELLFGWCISR